MKKKVGVFLFIFLIAATSVFAASVSRDIPSRADPGSTLTVTFSINGATAGELFTLEDQVPEGWAITDWSVTGATETKENINTRFEGNKYGWSFTPSGSSATITYTLTLPTTEGSYTFDAVWFDKSGQSRDTRTLAVRTVVCGDGICEAGENYDNCPADCPLPVTTTTAPVTTTTLPEEVPVERDYTLLIVLVVILVVLIVVLFVIKKKKPKEKLPKV